MRVYLDEEIEADSLEELRAKAADLAEREWQREQEREAERAARPPLPRATFDAHDATSLALFRAQALDFIRRPDPIFAERLGLGPKE
jgi:hypothetical protein